MLTGDEIRNAAGLDLEKISEEGKDGYRLKKVYRE